LDRFVRFPDVKSRNAHVANKKQVAETGFIAEFDPGNLLKISIFNTQPSKTKNAIASVTTANSRDQRINLNCKAKSGNSRIESYYPNFLSCLEV
jgi:hypothetical protein